MVTFVLLYLFPENVGGCKGRIEKFKLQPYNRSSYCPLLTHPWQMEDHVSETISPKLKTDHETSYLLEGVFATMCPSLIQHLVYTFHNYNNRSR
jgi:hypothetical protein